MQLEPCSACRRHLASNAPSCPFCGAQPSSVMARVLQHGGRMSRAAVFAGLTACYTNANTHDTTLTGTGSGSGSAVAAPAPAEPKPAPGTGAIVGYVKDGGSGQPVPNMMVMLGAAGERSVTSDATGRFVFDGLPPGRYTVQTMGNGNPRQQPPMTEVQVDDGVVAHTSVTTEVYVPDTGPCCKPYGAPPARHRVV